MRYSLWFIVLVSLVGCRVHSLDVEQVDLRQGMEVDPPYGAQGTWESLDGRTQDELGDLLHKRIPHLPDRAGAFHFDQYRRIGSAWVLLYADPSDAEETYDVLQEYGEPFNLGDKGSQRHLMDLSSSVHMYTILRCHAVIHSSFDQSVRTDSKFRAYMKRVDDQATQTFCP